MSLPTQNGQIRIQDPKPIDNELNHQAYMDVLDCKDPRYPDDEDYMRCFRFWKPLQKYPGDQHNR